MVIWAGGFCTAASLQSHIKHGEHYSRRSVPLEEIVQPLLGFGGFNYPVGVGQHLIHHKEHHSFRDILAQREILRQIFRSRAQLFYPGRDMPRDIISLSRDIRKLCRRRNQILL